MARATSFGIAKAQEKLKEERQVGETTRSQSRAQGKRPVSERLHSPIQNRLMYPTEPVYAPPTKRGIAVYTPLKTTKTEVMYVARDLGILQEPDRLPPPLPSGMFNASKYCAHHRIGGHTKKECRDLADDFKREVQEGHLKEYVDRTISVSTNAEKLQPQSRKNFKRRGKGQGDQGGTDQGPLAGVIDTISGGPTNRD